MIAHACLLLAASLAAQPLSSPKRHQARQLLFIGDSHTAQFFGQRLDADLSRDLPSWRVRMYGVCAASPHWFFEGLITRCGVYEHEPGHPPFIKKDGIQPTPMIGSLHRPSDSVTVVALGTNLIVPSTGTSAVGWWGLDTVTKLADTITKDYGERCIWIGPPYVRGAAWTAQPGASDVIVRLSEAIRQAAPNCEFIDSIAVTRPMKDARRPDGIHYKQRPAELWADSVAQRLESLLR